LASILGWIYAVAERYTLQSNSIAFKNIMSIGKLILHSDSAEPISPGRGSLISSLKEMGLLGEPLDSKKERYLAGERFLQLISFVGCSTNVCLTSKTSNNKGVCYLAVKGPFSQPQLIWDKNSRPPRCPACKQPITDWKQYIGNATIKCTQCENEARPDEISWGRNAGYGRIFIEINNIFPGEARPVPDLLEGLRRLTETEWSYFFTSGQI
jgi:hypothetical protein